MEITKLIFKSSNKFTYVAKIISGELFLDKNNEYNEDIIDVAWVFIDEEEKFDTNTAPLLKMLLDEIK